MNEISQHDRTWKALADPVRRDILDMLREEARTTTDICNTFRELSRFQVMNHMSALKEAGLIRVERRGRERINWLDAAPLRAAYEDWMREYEIVWAGRLGRLKRTVEERQRKQAMNLQALEHDHPIPLDIAFEIHIKAPPSAVFAGLTEDIGVWWGAPYLQCENAYDLILEARPGGRLLEQAPGSDGAIWGIIQEIRRDRFIAIEGRMNMAPAIFARTTFDLAEDKRETCLRFSTSAFGAFSEKHQKMYEDGWRDLLDNRLRTFVEHGEALGVRHRGRQ